MRHLLRSISLCLLVLAFTSVEAQKNYEPYTFTTLVGIPPDSTDGSGNAARFFQPSGIATDSAGNFFLSDTFNQTIRKITAAGVVTTLAGLAGSAGTVDGVGSAARFWYPTGLAVDGAGNLFVASLYSIRKVTPSGTVTTFAGSLSEFGSVDGTGTAARFSSPNGVAIDGAGNLYVADGNNHTIRRITPAGLVTTLAGLAGVSGTADGLGNAARFNNPRGLAVDSVGNLYVADAYNHTIRKVSPTGAVTTLAGLPGASGSADGNGSTARFLYPWSLSLDNAGNIFVADAYNNTIRRITSTGLVTTVAGLAQNSGSNDGTGGAARFSLPQALTIDASGNLVVADTNNCAIRKITPSYLVTTPIGLASPGSNDGAVSVARLQGPADVTVDGAGNIYIADSLNRTIRKVSPGGVVTTLAGSAGNSGSSDGNGSAARFSNPSGVAVDSSGNIYVADFSNFTIRKVASSGAVTTLAGLANQPGSSDGTGSAARFAYPYHLAADNEGNVYVADGASNTIRKITAAGGVTTIAGLAGNSGSIDGQGSAARFNSPCGIALDTSGNLWVTDEFNHTIRKVTSTGAVTTIAGLAGNNGNTDGSGAAARFANPRAIAVGTDSNIYVADTSNNTIRKITPSGTVTTLAGSGTTGSMVGPGSVARLWDPVGIAVDSSGKVYVADSGNNAIRVGVPSPPPPNDNFANATVINGSSGSLQGNNFAATEEAGEPQHAGYPGAHSVWFKWTAPQSGVFTFQPSNSSFNTLLGVYAGSQLNGLSALASASFEQAGVFRAVAGTAYLIAVDGYNAAAGSFTLSWSLTIGPPNDDFDNSQLISGTSGSVSGTTLSATVEPDEPNHGAASGYHSIWYSWTAPQDGRFIFDNAGGSYGIVIASYTGSAVNALALVANSDDYSYYYGQSRVNFRATSGTTYRIVLSTLPNFAAGPTVLNWHLANSPVNDDFANAQEIGGSSGSVTGSNIDGGKEPGEPAHAFDPGIASIWYKWTAPISGRVQFDVAGTFTNSGVPLLGVYVGSAVNHLRGVARGVLPARAQLEAVAGEVYHIAVDSANEDTSSDLTLSWVVLPLAQRTYEPYGFTTLAGNAPGNVDGTGNNVRFNRPNATALDPSGNLYVADTQNHTIRKVTSAGEVTTLAGSPGKSGCADGVGAAARFNAPLGIAVGPAGVIYVVDSSNNTIRKVTAAGAVTTMAGAAGFFGSSDGVGTNALFDLPFGIAVDGDGTVFVADSNSGVIRKITSDGEVTTLAGLAGTNDGRDGTGQGARFNYPTGLALDSTGNLYVADQYNYAIRKVTPAGVVTTYAGTIGYYGSNDGGPGVATFSLPMGVALDGAGNVYVVEWDADLIRKITPAREVSTLAGAAGQIGSIDGSGGVARFNLPGGIAATSGGTLFVADTWNSIVRKIDSSASVTTFAGLASPGVSDGTGSAARLSGSRGVAVDAGGNVYVADTANNAIRKITSAGVTTTLAGLPGTSGSANGTGTAARFRLPRGIAVDASGVVYVADTYNHMIRRITPAGVVTTVAGTTSAGFADGLGSAARFRLPGALSIDSSGNLYVADTNNHTIRKITPATAVTTLAGTAQVSGISDGTGSAARFNYPRGITCDGAGNLFVADHDNCTIRKIIANGLVTTVAGGAGVAGSNDGPSNDAHFLNPSSIAADLKGSLYIADRGNSLIRKIALGGAVTTLAGALNQQANQNGVGSAARFEFPSGIAVDSAGRLYLADTYNNTIRIGRRAPLSALEMANGANGHRLLTGTISPVAEAQIMATDNLATPFTLLATVTADANGIYEYDDVEGGSLPRRFYRLLIPDLPQLGRDSAF